MACVLACTRGVNQAVREGGRELLAVDYSRCAACGECLKVCCYDARSIIGREYTARELNEQILVDRAYYQVKDEEGNTGGVTLTGGEPMSQFPFVERLLDELDGIHVCMETSGFAPEEQFARLLGKVDLFLFDYKATDPEKHREFCGVDNRLIQSNLKFLCDHGLTTTRRILRPWPGWWSGIPISGGRRLWPTTIWASPRRIRSGWPGSCGIRKIPRQSKRKYGSGGLKTWASQK